MQCVHKSKSLDNTPGFALIATISVMVLLVMIALAMLSLSTIELRSSRNGGAMAEAQANARMSLMLAIGELQKEVGPDQRVTGRAAILDSLTESDEADGVTHPHWMGTWNAWDDWLNSSAITSTYQKGRQTRFRRWLVSHPDASALQDMSLATTGTASDLVKMLTLPDDSAGLGTVQAPAVTVDNGRYAWWVTGENQKALITDQAERDDDFQRMHGRSHWSKSRVGWLDGMAAAPDTEEAYEKSVSLNSYGLGEDDQALSKEVKKRYHALTTQSLGVLSNVRHGGLKKDLNLLLENEKLPDEFGTYGSSNFGGNIVPIRSAQGHMPSAVYPQNINFTSWYKLHQYYQLYRGGGEETAADSTPMPFNGKGVWGSKSNPNINFNWHRQNLDYFGIGRTPIVTRLMMVFSTRRVRSADGVNYDYKLGINPVVVLWNPYNVTLHSPRLWIQIGPGALQYKSYVNGVVRTNWQQLRRENGKFELNIYPMEGPGQEFHNRPIVLKPGETRIYSAVSGFINAVDFKHAELYPGYQSPDADGGFEVDLQGLTGLPSGSNVDLAMRLSDSRTEHGGQYQMYWTVRNAQTGNGQRYNELAANPVEDAKPIYLAEDAAGKRVRFSNSTQRIPFANFQFVMKSGEDLRNPGISYQDDDFRCRNFIHANPSNQRAMYGEATKRMRGMSQYHVQIDTGSGNSVSPDFEPGTNRSYIGSAVSLGGSLWPGQTRVVTNEFPLVPITSIASLMHFKLNPGDARNFGTGRHLWEVSANQALAIGNSFAHPLIPGNAIYEDVADASCRGNPIQMKLIRDFHDHAYLNNDALWDDWYCSGITREDQGLWQNGRAMSGVVDEFENGTGKLANPHLVPWKETLGAETMQQRLVSGSVPKEDGWKTASRYMMLRGAFNVNSTSADAWKAFLAGMQDEEFNYIDENGSVKVKKMPDDRVLFSRFSLPASADEGADAGDPNSWLGVRMLTEKQIDRLARECVRQVKQRGPFLNMSDFANRRLATDETGVCGALQAAIDWDEFLGRSPGGSSDESINARFKAGDDYISAAQVNDWELEFPLAAKGSRYAGIPGYLTQADVLKRIGNNITARDDTFRIRSYGEARDKNGNILARAWCEAVVQRLPQYLDASDDPETPQADLTSSINRGFGRKLRIVSFRWLAGDEI